jgi:hypothetical protein
LTLRVATRHVAQGRKVRLAHKGRLCAIRVLTHSRHGPKIAARGPKQALAGPEAPGLCSESLRAGAFPAAGFDLHRAAECAGRGAPPAQFNARFSEWFFMKSDHRHELQTNELAKYLDKIVAVVNAHGNAITVGICVVTLLLVVGIFWYRSIDDMAARSWAALDLARTPEDMQDVAEGHASADAGLWARLVEGELRLEQGVQSMFLNERTGKEQLQSARASFEALLANKKSPPEVRERALFGLGRVQESVSTGDSNDALAAYEQLLKEFPGSYYAADVRQRIDALKKGSTQEFYQWFASFERPKPVEKGPKDTGSSADDDDDLGDLQRKLKGLTADSTASEEDENEDMPAEDGSAGPKKPGLKRPPAPDEDSADDPEPANEPKLRRPAEPIDEEANPRPEAPPAPEDP